MYQMQLNLEIICRNNLLYYHITYYFILADFRHNIYANLLKHRVIYSAARDIDMVIDKKIAEQVKQYNIVARNWPISNNVRC